MPSATSAHRPDIDGLRALAVLFVIVHHVLPGALPGGFVGVDMFFVISGYLVTRLIDENMQADRFRYSEFVWKRCCRILPALLALLVGTMLLGVCILTGPELVGLARHVAAGSLGASNLLLWREVGYFDLAATQKPLLHLWSLGVEEQFYLVWPLLLSVLPLDRRVRALALAAVVLASLLVSENLAYSDPSQAFYLLHSRAWELGAGGSLALAVPLFVARATAKRRRLPALRNVCSAIGGSLLVVAVCDGNSGGSWPGLSAIAPVLGTALLLTAGPDAWVNRTLLTARPAQWIGQRSYVLYLWHWPPLAFLHILAQEQTWSVQVVQRCAILLMIPVVLVADATFRWIERPIRRRSAALAARETIRARHLAPFGCALTATVLAAMLITQAHGFPSRYGTVPFVDAVSELASASADSVASFEQRSTRCHLADKGTATWCWRIPGEGRGTAVIGDSHAHVVFAGLAAEPRGAPLLLTGRNACAPIIQDQPIAERTAEICRRAMLIAHDAVLRDTTIGTVVIVARGPAYVTGAGFGVDSARAVVPVAISATLHDTVALRSAYERGLERAVRALQSAGKRVIIVTGVPEIGFLPAECLVGRPLGLRRVKAPCALPRTSVDARATGYRTLLAAVAARNPPLAVFDATPLFCDASLCHAARGSQLLYQDGNHLTLAGSRIVARALTPLLAAGRWAHAGS